ncbi:uncharacterized protein TNCV_4509931 [Trichonephila clavipes]|nr:uncharacterized protein TNCV_4509931 [Trichonephila clavipes]
MVKMQNDLSDPLAVRNGVRQGDTLACLLFNQALEKVENGAWRRRSNLELHQSHKGSDIANFIKIQRIEWAGHVVRIDKNRTTKKVINAQRIGTRRKGRSNLRWFDGPEKYLLVLGTKNWRTLARRRLAWKRLLEKAKSHPRLSNH